MLFQWVWIWSEFDEPKIGFLQQPRQRDPLRGWGGVPQGGPAPAQAARGVQHSHSVPLRSLLIWRQLRICLILSHYLLDLIPIVILDIIRDTYGHKNKYLSDFNRLPHVCPFPRSWAISHVACNCFTVYGRRNGRGVLTLQRHYVKYVLHWTWSWNSPVTEGKLSYHHHHQPVCGGQQPVTSLTTEESFE